MIQERFGIQPELIKGSNGVFEVHLDGQPVYSKKSSGRFPEDGEVEALLAKSLEA